MMKWKKIMTSWVLSGPYEGGGNKSEEDYYNNYINKLVYNTEMPMEYEIKIF
jgi:hypothetical protein